MSKNTVTIRKVYGDSDREPLNVESGGDIQQVRVVASGDAALHYWGPVDLTMTLQMARELAAALVACADEQETT